MKEFIGRLKELSKLNDLFSDPESKSVAIYGKRRVGKTALIKEFCKGKRAIFFTCLEISEQSNIESMHIVLSSLTNEKIPEFKSFLTVLETLKKMDYPEKTVIILDEFPYLAGAAKYVPSALQAFIDHVLPTINAMLIISGSSIHSMKREISDMDRPLFGRFENRMEIKPLSYLECREFHPTMSDEDYLRTYMTVGGIPYYHKIMKESSYEDCVLRNFLKENSPLYDEITGIIGRELSPIITFTDIIKSIADGINRISDIANKIGISLKLCRTYIDELISLDIVEQVNLVANSPKRPVFYIKDPIIGFYFAVVQKNIGLINTMRPKEIYTQIFNDIDTLMGHSFEGLCKEYIVMNYSCRNVGTWRGRAGTENVDIDIVAEIIENDNNVALLCECKFRKRITKIDAYSTLKQRSKFISGYNNVRYIIFSLSEFDEELIDVANADNLLELVGVKDLLKTAETEN
jgi:Predicted ATPase (AAA+ superfamily)